MPDYDLGRAHGEIIINADTSGADRAAASMAGTSAEAEALNKTLGRTNTSLDEHSRHTRATDDVVKRYRQTVHELEDAESKLQDTLRNSSSTADDISRARQTQADAANKAREAEETLHEAMSKSLGMLESFVGTFDNFNKAKDRSRKNVQEFGHDLDSFTEKLEKTNEGVEKLAHTFTNVLATAFKATALTGLGGGAAGGLGLLGAGGLDGLVAVATGAAKAIQNVSGAAILLPAAFSAAGASALTLKVGLEGVTKALGDSDNAEQFERDLKQLAPAAREVTETLARFENSFRGARMMIQQSLFEPIVNDIRPLVQTWLPALMHAGQAIGGAFGELGHTAAGGLLDPQNMASFNTFIHNVTDALHELQPAVQPIIKAFFELDAVGSGAFPRLASEIAKIANEFSGWIDVSSKSGKLTDMLNNAIAALDRGWQMAKNFGSALMNIFQIAGAFHGGFLGGLLEDLNAWTSSTQGQDTLISFFSTLNEAGKALKPVIEVIAQGLATVGIHLTQLGVAISPGLQAFFGELGAALNILGHAMVESAPAFNAFLAAFGQFVLQVMSQLGPELPELFKSLSEALIALAPDLTEVTHVLVEFLHGITPGDIETFVNITSALYAFSSALRAMRVVIDVVKDMRAFAAVLGLLTGPIGICVTVAIALGSAFAYAYTHSKSFHDGVNNLLNKTKEFASHLAGEASNALNNFMGLLSRAPQNALNFAGSLSNAIQTLANNLRTQFNNMVSQAEGWGRNLIQGFIHGIENMFGPVGRVAGQLMGILRGHMPSSPAEVGPFSGNNSPQNLGQNLATGYAEGIASGASSVSDAAYGLADGAVGNLSRAAVSAGQVGSESASGFAGISYGGSVPGGPSGREGGGSDDTSGGGGAGGTLASISQLMQDSWNLAKTFGGVFTGFFNLAANAAGPGSAAASAATSTAMKGLEALFPPAIPLEPGTTGPSVAQESVPGVPQFGSSSSAPGSQPNPDPNKQFPTSPSQKGVGQDDGYAALGADSPTVVGSGTGNTVPLVKRPDGTYTSSNSEWAKLIARESSGVPDIVNKDPNDANAGANASQGLFQFTPDTWHRLGYSGNPKDAPAELQAEAAAKLLQQNPTGSDWGLDKNIGRENAAILLQGLVPSGGGNVQGQATPTISGRAGALSDADMKSFGLDKGSATTGKIEPGTRSSLEDAPLSLPSPSTPSIGPGGLNLQTIEFAAQKYAGDCIDASARIILSHSGINLSEDEIMKTIPQGTNIDAQASGLNKLNPAGIYKAIQGSGGSAAALFNAVRDSINNGTGSILNVAPGSSIAGRNFSEGHFIAATGYNADGTINLSDTANNNHLRYSVTAEDAFQATRGRGIVAGTGTGPPPIAGTQTNVALTGKEEPIPVNIAQQSGVPVDRPDTTVGTGSNHQVGQVDPNSPIPGLTRADPTLPQNPMNEAQRFAGGKTIPGMTRAGPTLQQNPVAEPTAAGDSMSDVPSVNSSSVGMDVAGAVSGAGQILGDAFAIFNDVLSDIKAGSNLIDTAISGMPDTNSVINTINQIKPFIQTGSDIAKTGADVTGFAGQIAAAGGPFGSAASGALSIVSGVFSGVSAIFSGVNEAIDVGEEVWNLASKYAGFLAGANLGGSLGALGGNVQMLLNTQTGKVLASSLDNPKAQNAVNMPEWLTGVDLNRTRGQQMVQNSIMNIYAGPGQSTSDMMSDVMWSVNTMPSQVSVAGQK